MASESSKSVHLAAWIEQVNDQWKLHNHSCKQAEEIKPCLAFAISSRYWEAEGFEWRLGVSYGGNPFPPERGPYVMLTPQPGKFVFGIHLLGIRGSRITVFDKWMESRRAENGLTIEQAHQMANKILQELPSWVYAKHFSFYYMRDLDRELKRSEPPRLEGLEVMPVNGFETEEERRAIWEKEVPDIGKWLNELFGGSAYEKAAKSRKKT